MAAQGQATGGDAGQQQGDVQGGDQSALEQGLASLTENFQQFQQQLQPIAETYPQMAEFFQNFQQQQAPEEQQQQGFDPGELEQTFGLDPQGAQQLAQALDEHTQSRIEQAIQQAVGPLQERLGGLQWEMDASQLASEIPDLQDPEKAQQVMDTANLIADKIGNPELATHPDFVRVLAYGMLGMQYMQDAQQQAAQAPSAAHMEGGGGAAPAQAQEDPTKAALARLGFGDGSRSFGNGAHRNALAP